MIYDIFDFFLSVLDLESYHYCMHFLMTWKSCDGFRSNFQKLIISQYSTYGGTSSNTRTRIFLKPSDGDFNYVIYQVRMLTQICRFGLWYFRLFLIRFRLRFFSLLHEILCKSEIMRCILLKLSFITKLSIDSQFDFFNFEQFWI